MFKGNKPDILVIGAGMSSAAFCWSLSEAGFKVVCLEQGPWMNPEQYPTTHLDGERHLSYEFHSNPNVRNLSQDYPINTSDTPINPLMFNAVGGSAIHWGAHFPRMKPSDFKVKTLDGVADDWPISYDDLTPFFDVNDKITGVAGLSGNPAYPPMPARQTPPLSIGKQGAKLAEGFDKLGWHWWPAESAINSTSYDGRPACTYGGPCISGCYNKAKSSADLTYWPRAIKNGVLLKTGVRVSEITLNNKGLANGVIYYDQNGVVNKIYADAVVLAGNGIGTPRLLLNSKSPSFPDGLANSSGLVGKNLMFHPVAAVAGVFEEEIESHKGPLACSITSYEHYETDTSRGFVRGFQLQLNRQLGPITTSLGGALEKPIPWGKYHHNEFDERLNKLIPIAALIEDLPELHNEVILDKNIVDSNGIPSPKVNYTVSANSKKMLEYSIQRCTEVLEAAGSKRILVNPLLETAGWHLLGTARMGDDPKTSVVNKFGSAHDVKNLFVIDGSVFVTAGAVNPTSTIQAIALFMANNLKKNARNSI